jgi:nucleotide-binding universal stress UspA family protein
MPDRVLVPFDGSPLAERALEHAARNLADAAIVAVYVVNPLDSILSVEAGGLPVAADWYEDERERAAAALDEATALAADRGVEIETAVVTGQPTREILAYADEHDVDQIVLGSHGRDGVRRAILGSVAETVVRRAGVPVTVVR